MTKVMWKSRLDGSPEEYAPDQRRGQIAQEHADQVRDMKALLGRVEHVSLLLEDGNFAPRVIGPDWDNIEALWHHFAEKDIRAAIHTYLELEDGLITKIIQLSSNLSNLSHLNDPGELRDANLRSILFRTHDSLEHTTNSFRALEYAIELCAAWAKLSDSHGYAPRDLISQLRRSRSDPEAYQSWLDSVRHRVRQALPHHSEPVTKGHTLKDPHISNTPPSDAPQLHATMLEWQVLPPDWVPRSSQRELTHKHLHKERLDRIQELDKYKPDEWYEGSHLGEHTYFVAVFGSLVVADSPDPGNALYYVVPPQAEKWKQIFHLHKMQALSQGAKRIIHGKKSWQAKLAELMRVYRSKGNGRPPSARPKPGSRVTRRNRPRVRR